MSVRNGIAVPPKPPVRKTQTAVFEASVAAPAARPASRWWPLAGLLLAAGVGAYVLWSTVFAGAAVPAAAAAAAPEARFVAAPGLVESSGGLRDMAFQLPGQLKAVLVEEGQAVKQGQLLAELDNDEARANLHAAQADLGMAQAQASVLAGNLAAETARARHEADRLQAEFDRLQAGARKEELERARAETKAAEIEWKRREDDARRYMAAPTVSSEQERQMTRGQAEIAHAQYLAAEAKLRELEAGARKEDLARATALLKVALADLERIEATRAARLDAVRHQVAQAQARLQAAEANLRKTQLVAPIDGVVVWKFRQPGETVGVLPPERVLTVADIAQLRVRADVDEADFAKLRPGQKVKVTADAYGNQSFSGRVERVSHAAGEKRFSTGEARERRDVKIVETLIAFDQPPPLKLGLRVTTSFTLDE